ncbi:TonB-dependent receptor plug domain-containing protein [Arcobacter vandammei]|uniref:TonB-dependent receptor plug domain-containing protein n=1 Tax=Arcobacter vandammei TaxID=2782243 RepID=UPI0018E03321|nr:TonB-dependent receptor [Arcobacter vandammei]
MIERIEIIKGPKSSIYGSQAIGGVINIITKKYAKKIYGEIDVQAGFSSAENGGDEQKYSANIGGNISDKLYMFLAVNKNKRDATGGDGFGYNSSYQQVAINDATYIEGVDSTDGLLKLKYNFDDTQSIYASYLKGKEERKEFDKSVSYKLDKDIYSFGYEKAFDSVAFSLDYSRSKIDSKVDSMFAKYTHGLTTDNIKGEAKISALKYNYIVVGTETLKDRYERTLPIGTNQYDFDNRANSYYIQDEVELGDFILSFGGRIDDNQKYGNDFSPNAGVVYKIDEQQRLKLNYGEGFKAPLLTQGSSGFYSTGIWGNDDLKAETSKSYELAYEFYGQDTIFKSSIFKTDLKNMIKSESGHGNNGKQSMYVNVDEASTRGFELGVEHNLTEEHILNANYTYVKTEDKKTEKALTYKPKNTFNIGLSSELGWGISSYLSANYIGTQYTDAANKTKAKGYTLFNAQISKEITKDLTARIGVDNITNEKFDDNEPYYLEQRFAYVGLNYKF